MEIIQKRLQTKDIKNLESRKNKDFENSSENPFITSDYRDPTFLKNMEVQVEIAQQMRDLFQGQR